MKRIILIALFIALALTGGVSYAEPSGSVPASAEVSFGITPREIDLGIISPGRVVHSTVNLKHASKHLDWLLEDPEGWEKAGDKSLSGGAPSGAESIVVAIKFDEIRDPGPAAFVRMVAFTASGEVKYSRVLGMGRQRLLLPFRSADGVMQVGINFELLEKDLPVLNVEPHSIDLGSSEAGKIQTAQIKITNRGTKKIHWRVSVPGVPPGNQKGPGLYVSFQNDESRGKGNFIVPSRLEGMMQIAGNWMEQEGFPSSFDPGNSLVFSFAGTGASITIRKDTGAGSVRIYFDEELIMDADCRSGKRERWEIALAENRAQGAHSIKLVATGGPVTIEGVRAFSNEILNPPPGWLKVSPDAGDTTGETDYVSLRALTEKMDPGLYAGRVHVRSDGGEAVVDVSIRVTASGTAKILNVYKYARGLDFLFTSSPEREDQNVLRYYRRHGLAFRLFRENTPGTKRLYRWYHPGKGDHYYSSEPEGEKNLYGYIPEGPIGNIATSKLPATRELYRWYNPKTGLHLFTLDLRGEGYGRKGYRYEGIVGYVR